MASHVNHEPKFENGPLEEENESDYEDVDMELCFPNDFTAEAGSFTAPQATSTLKRRAYMTMSKKAGIVFPCNVFSRNLKVRNYSQNFDKSKWKPYLKVRFEYSFLLVLEAVVYLSATLEYLTAEILELAGDASHEDRRVRITPRNIQNAVKKDAELSELLQDVTFASGGVLPNIHPALLPKKNK